MATPDVPENVTAAADNDVITSQVPEEYDMTLANKMHYITSVYVGTILVILGLIGNVLSIIVWRRKKMTSSTGTYLIGQAVADAGLLLFFFITDSILMMVPAIKTSYAYGVFYSYVGYPIFFLFVVCSIWFTVGVTVDRYIQVCWITHAKDMCNPRRALTGLGIISLNCFIVNTPHFATYEPVADGDRNASEPGFRFTEFGNSGGSVDYEFWVHCMFLVLAPWVTIFTLNMLIIQRVSKINRQMGSTRSESAKDKTRRTEAQMTRLLLTVTFTFLVLIAVQCITQCFYMLKTGNRRVVSEAFAVAKLGIVVNSSINFLLYCVSGKRFRKELQIVVCGGLPRRLWRRISFSTSYEMSSSSRLVKSEVSKSMSTA